VKRECVVRDVTILDLIFYIVYLYGIASRWFLSRFLGYARNDTSATLGMTSATLGMTSATLGMTSATLGMTQVLRSE